MTLFCKFHCIYPCTSEGRTKSRNNDVKSRQAFEDLLALEEFDTTLPGNVGFRIRIDTSSYARGVEP